VETSRLALRFPQNFIKAFSAVHFSNWYELDASYEAIALRKNDCVTANPSSSMLSHKIFADRKTRFCFLMPQTTDRTSYHTRSEQSEQSLRLTAKKIIGSKYYDQAMLFRVTAESNPLSIHLSFLTNCDNAAVTQIWRNKRQEWLIKKPLSCSVSKFRFLGTWKLFCGWALYSN